MIESVISFGIGPAHPATQTSWLDLNDQSERDFWREDAIGYWYHVRSVDGIWDQELRTETHNLPQRHGTKSGDYFYAGRTIVISGRVEAKNLELLRTAQRALQAAFYDMKDHPLQFTMWEEDDVYIICRKNQKIDMPESQEDGGPFFKRPFVIQLYADDPWMYKQSNDARYQAYS